MESSSDKSIDNNNADGKTKMAWKELLESFERVTTPLAKEGFWGGVSEIATVKAVYAMVLLKVLVINSLFVVAFYLLFEQLPGINRFSAIKLVLYCILYECLGFSCNSSWLSGNIACVFPNVWYLFRLGSIKIPMFHKELAVSRNEVHILIICCYFLTIIYSFLFVSDLNINNSFAVPIICLFWLYFMITDRTVFLSSRPEYYGYYLICLYFDNGWITGCRLLQIMVCFSRLRGFLFLFAFGLNVCSKLSVFELAWTVNIVDNFEFYHYNRCGFGLE